MQINFKDGIAPTIHSVKVNESFIVASFYEHPDICVWDAKTKNLVHIRGVSPNRYMPFNVLDQHFVKCFNRRLFMTKTKTKTTIFLLRDFVCGKNFCCLVK